MPLARLPQRLLNSRVSCWPAGSPGYPASEAEVKITVKRALIALGVVVLGVGAYIAWWLITPLFVDTVVEEEFPFAAAAEVPADMTRVEVEATMEAIAEVDSEVAEAMPQEMETAGVVKLLSGDFRDADRFHRGEGAASVYLSGDGTLILRLEDFRVTNGPDLRVLIVPSSNQDDGSEVTTEGSVEIGRLKGNVGNQNYEIPPDYPQDGLGSIIIYCKPFRVVFAIATLTAP